MLGVLEDAVEVGTVETTRPGVERTGVETRDEMTPSDRRVVAVAEGVGGLACFHTGDDRAMGDTTQCEDHADRRPMDLVHKPLVSAGPNLRGGRTVAWR